MAETKFTPGPWFYDEDGGAMWLEGGMGMSQSLASGAKCEHVEFLQVNGPDREPIIQVLGPSDDDSDDFLSWPCTDEQAYANAHLIAAAPALYAALDSGSLCELLGRIEDSGSQELWALAQQFMELRDTALSQARGEDQ